MAQYAATTAIKTTLKC